jgi:hypothetical protein
VREYQTGKTEIAGGIHNPASDDLGSPKASYVYPAVWRPSAVPNPVTPRVQLSTQRTRPDTTRLADSISRGVKKEAEDSVVNKDAKRVTELQYIRSLNHVPSLGRKSKYAYTLPVDY